MIYLVVNGLLVEGETVAEIHMRATIKHYDAHKEHHPRESFKEDDTITSIMREIFKELKENK